MKISNVFDCTLFLHGQSFYSRVAENMRLCWLAIIVECRWGSLGSCSCLSGTSNTVVALHHLGRIYRLSKGDDGKFGKEGLFRRSAAGQEGEGGTCFHLSENSAYTSVRSGT